MIKVNGEKTTLDGKSVEELLKIKGFDENRVAVEICGEIVPKKSYDATILKDGDLVEIVSFVGGG